jgi:hypothetical protein
MVRRCAGGTIEHRWIALEGLVDIPAGSSFALTSPRRSASGTTTGGPKANVGTGHPREMGPEEVTPFLA